MSKNNKRNEIELLIYNTFDAVDKTGSNTEYYRNLFRKMSDEQFFKFIRRRLPFRFHTAVFKVEPSMSDVFDGFKVLNKPLMEKIKLPYLYINKNGEPIESKECLVIYCNIKRMKQMRIKKTNTAMSIDQRDMKTGRLLKDDKGGIESIKEFEGAAALGLENVLLENSRIRADAMKAKAEAYNMINNVGKVSINDISQEKTDSIAKNTFNVYLLGANLHSNLVDTGYITPHTVASRKNISMRQ